MTFLKSYSFIATSKRDQKNIHVGEVIPYNLWLTLWNCLFQPKLSFLTKFFWCLNLTKGLKKKKREKESQLKLSKQTLKIISQQFKSSAQWKSLFEPFNLNNSLHVWHVFAGCNDSPGRRLIMMLQKQQKTRQYHIKRLSFAVVCEAARCFQPSLIVSLQASLEAFVSTQYLLWIPDYNSTTSGFNCSCTCY